MMSKIRVGELVIGAESRGQRRARRRSQGALAARLAAERKAERRRIREETKALWQGDFLPALGEAGPRKGRQFSEARIEFLRTTTKILRTAYPFVVEEGLGPQGMVIGRDAVSASAFCFDPFVLYQDGIISNTNMTLAGVIGSAKSSLMKCLALRGCAFGYRTFIPGDVKGEWSKVVEAVGGAVISVGGTTQHRLNPLDPGRRPQTDENGKWVDDEAWSRLVRSQRLGLLRALTSTLKGSPLDEEDETAIACALDRAVGRGGTVLVGTVVDELLEPSDEWRPPKGVRDHAELAAMGRRPGLILQRLVEGDLAGMFDGPSTVRFDPSALMMSIDLHGIAEGDEKLRLLMTCTQAWMESALRGKDLGQRFLIYDEAHRLMGAPGLLARMRDSWKLARAWGVANVLVLHRLSDSDSAGSEGSAERALAEGLVADTSTRIVYRQEADQLERTASRLGLNDRARGLVSSLNPGVGLWLVGGRTFVVAHDRTEWEIALTDTDEAMGGRR